MSAPDEKQVLAGLVERVTFHNEENGFCVLRVKVRGQKDLITVLGHAASISAGEWVTATGVWQNDRTHGLQFRAQFLKATEPTSIEGMEKYLASGMIRGVGPVYAKRLIQAFGDKVFDVIQSVPGRLREVDGIGPRRAERIIAAWAEQKIVREIMIFLHSHGVGTSRAVRIYKTYGNDAVQLMSENPYRLAKDIRGIGFKTADAIASRLGIAKDAMIRVRAGISYALTEALNEGHCGLPVNELSSLAEKLLDVPAALIETAMTLELAEKTIVKASVEGTECVFLAGLYKAEKGIAERILQLAAGKPSWPEIDAAKAIEWLATKSPFPLADSQKQAVELALSSKVMHALVKAVPSHAALLIVGDIDQLPSVGPGQVLADLIGSGSIPVVRLTEVFRQAAQSRIVTMAHRINKGVMPEFEKPEGESDYYFVEANEPERALDVILELVRERIPKRFGLDPIRDIQILCPMNRGGLGARSLNIDLQKALNPPGQEKIEKFGSTFGPKEKVMQIENDYDKEVYNGDLGFITKIDAEAGEIAVNFDGREIVYESGELDSLVLAYATTIHKAQGSEYPAVILPVTTQHYPMLQRNLLYTGLTRGKRLVVLVGQRKAVAIAVRNVSGRKRWSKLREWLVRS